jgi:hypothetical protein
MDTDLKWFLQAYLTLSQIIGHSHYIVAYFPSAIDENRKRSDGSSRARSVSDEGAGGLALMVLPTVVVGNELLILAGVTAAVGLWFLAHRHGQLRGLMDANKNGIDDRDEVPAETKEGV